MIYLNVGNKDKNRVCKQKIIYEKIFKKIVEVFEKRIRQLKILQVIGVTQIEWLTEETQLL